MEQNSASAGVIRVRGSGSEPNPASASVIRARGSGSEPNPALSGVTRVRSSGSEPDPALSGVIRVRDSGSDRIQVGRHYPRSGFELGTESRPTRRHQPQTRCQEGGNHATGGEPDDDDQRAPFRQETSPESRTHITPSVTQEEIHTETRNTRGGLRPVSPLTPAPSHATLPTCPAEGIQAGPRLPTGTWRRSQGSAPRAQRSGSTTTPHTHPNTHPRTHMEASTKDGRGTRRFRQFGGYPTQSTRSGPR